jgi:hypothetical protein
VAGSDDQSRRGFGLARIAQGDCELLSFVGGAGGGTVGAGPEWRGPLTSVQLGLGALWGIDGVGRQFVRIDPSTGERTLFPMGADAGTWDDPAPNPVTMTNDGSWWRLWSGARVDVMDPATGESRTLKFASDSAGRSATFEMIAQDPTRPLLYGLAYGAVLVINRLSGRTNWLVQT